MAERYASLKQGLVGAWIPSVSGSGLLLPDVSGRGNNGTLTNMASDDWVSAQYGRALDFDNTDDKVDCGSAVPISGAVTVSGWIKRNGTPLNGNAVVCAKGGLQGDSSSTFALYFNQLLGWSWFVVNESQTLAIVRSNTFTSLNVWYPVCGVASANGLQIYINGVLQNTASGGIAKSSTHSVVLGALTDAITTHATNAQLDDIRIYNRALSESEIRLLSSEPGIGFKPAKKLSRFSQRFTYQPPKAKTYSVVRVKETDHANLRQGLVGAWCPSIAGSGNLLPDLSGRGNNGTLTNMASDDWVSAQYGRALDFDGVNDYVSVTGSITTSAATFIAWIYRRGNQGQYDGILFSRSTNITGMNFQTSNQLAYAWNDAANTYNWASNVTVPDSVWCMCAIVVAPSIATAYVCQDGKISSATNSVAHNSTTLNAIQIGRDSLSTRYTNALIDDARIYNRALTDSEVRILAQRPGIGLRQDRDRQTFYQTNTRAQNHSLISNMF